MQLNSPRLAYIFFSSGTKSGKGSVKCQSCEGRGVKIMIRQMGMMIQQTQSVCPECQGKGETVKDKDRCAQCGGKQVIQVCDSLGYVFSYLEGTKNFGSTS